MPADGPWGTVIDITDLVGGDRDRDLRQVLAGLRTTGYEPPPTLLPDILARVDDLGRFSWPAPRTHRWVAYAGGVAAGAAGAVMLASRSRRLTG